ncbi:Hypothetical protein LBF_2895 [Leptospira biflexa serovar Patoc strain 'Patoc 1 (Ames)']|uniref:Lipoprotein n=1 Tax=Leptospira biflexa serovar Patoc (strain Patoc 1 / ATCC 23582 / Paris) TaxID=456481 RepID=B0SPG0_LEPBP|nr:hypothetical protein [Leptospira biflexa]ABZ95370.1 Hypothetical protein LBF_2895 [Leptospira biflexa serovar Patoc strain 'Patoc 1 (Ames)']ABZ99066.1 Hypothetical protein; putative signal peptide [Leptospira biflexa serovar Patoc strain 'Patoc 1 (Paris)']
MFRFLLAIFVFLLLSCKLNLNNPNDPKNEDFWVRTVLQSFLLNDGCRNFSAWERRYGTGSYLTYGTDFLFLSNGDIIVVGFTEDPIIPGDTKGITSDFQGTPGSTLNLFLLRLSRSNGDIMWVDYLGQGFSNLNFNPRLHQFTNGDLAISFLAIGNGISLPNMISGKADANKSVYLGRHSTNGNRIWYTYLDSLDIDNYLVTTVDSFDQFHFFVTLVGTNGHASFPELTAVTNSSLGSTSDTDILSGIVNGEGLGRYQTYISSANNDFAFNVTYANGFVYLAGTTAGSISGSTHPNPGTDRPFITKLNVNTGNREFLIYNGHSSASYGDSRQLIVSQNAILQLVTTNLSWSSLVREPMQSDTEHYAFAQYDLSGNLQWLSFLGSDLGDIAIFEEPPTILDLTTGLWRNRSRVPNTISRYSSGSAVSTGEGSSTYQIADVYIQPNNGTFEKIRYSSNLTSPTIKRTDQMKELCTGKLGYMDRIYTTGSTTPTQLGIQTSLE